MLKRVMTYYHTIKYLRWIQIKYRIKYYFSKLRLENITMENVPVSQQLKMLPSIPSYLSYLGNRSFSFLNIKQHFQGEIDWNYHELGKLWTYNLNYFDFLGQENISKNEGVKLIHDFISKKDGLKDGLEPYPISLRTIFWIKFIIKHDIQDKEINQFLYQQLQLLSKIPEYHLMGNHLMENGFALLFGAVFFNDKKILELTETILIQELNEQILADGAHFELSPMYHQTILFRVLDSINLLQNSHTLISNNSLLKILINKAEIMCGWLKEMTFKNGDIPLVNDSCIGIAPKTVALLQYAKSLKIIPQKIVLKESGYRKFEGDNFEMVVDVGNIGPDYIPGHAHSDTFNFVLYHYNQALIVDTGISTYEKNEQRNLERSTVSHNTVVIDNQDQSHVWGGFRVAKRARIIQLEESKNQIKAQHDGYKNIQYVHERSFSFLDEKIIINDKVIGMKKGTAFFHFHHDINISQKENSIIWDNGKIVFQQPYHNTDVNHSNQNIFPIITNYSLPTGFNKTQKAQKVSVVFNEHLQTEIYFTPKSPKGDF